MVPGGRGFGGIQLGDLKKSSVSMEANHFHSYSATSLSSSIWMWRAREKDLI